MKRKLKDGAPTKLHKPRRPVAKKMLCGECEAWALIFNGKTGECAELKKLKKPYLTLASETCRLEEVGQ